MTDQRAPTKRPNPVLLAGLALTLAFGLVTKWEPGKNPNIAYTDRIATSRIATVCNGHTGRDIIVGKWYSDDQCNVWTTEDLTHAYGAVYRCTYVPMTPQQLGALTDFALNVGGTALCNSTFLLNANAGLPASVWCPKMGWFNKSGGKVRLGLVHRRNDEIKLCLEK